MTVVQGATRKALDRDQTNAWRVYGSCLALLTWIGFLIFKQVTVGHRAFSPWQFWVFDLVSPFAVGFLAILMMDECAKASFRVWPKASTSSSRSRAAASSLALGATIGVTAVILAVSFEIFVGPAVPERYDPVGKAKAAIWLAVLLPGTVSVVLLMIYVATASVVARIRHRWPF